MRKLFVCFLKKSFVLELFFSEYNDKNVRKCFIGDSCIWI